MTIDEQKDLISRVLTLAAEDFDDLAESSVLKLGRDAGGATSVTVFTRSQVVDALLELKAKFMRQAEAGEGLENWS